ncbi:MAG: hypothetical protein PHQ98_01630 [Candidatus ainarchaeum sp.]|nr:hypothetical protein [Candidatus ainarchaeum sp.]
MRFKQPKPIKPINSNLSSKIHNPKPVNQKPTGLYVTPEDRFSKVRVGKREPPRRPLVP